MSKTAAATTQQNPELNELSKQLALIEMRAKIADANSRIAESHAKGREAHLRLKKAEKELAGLN